ncbi:hypothetical protein [Pseudomonas putida]|uniref:hypothetical protein n=1 Tax=Pseudomonas putida TaxID=303 RepID=UPI00235D1241|nr:hypothetical protein [Pseudomonas putida]GLO23538.1 hypothetical protein PPUJ21368_13650 [Pseudomonas putida]HDS0969528.1 hypothetical protein [Pseudomonas putida]
MKRMLGVIFCLGLALVANAEPKLKVIDLGSEAPVSAEAAERGRKYIEAQEAAARITPDEALEFISRLKAVMEEGHELTISGGMDAKAQRNHAIALNKLSDEGDRFGGPLAQFKSCGDAASDAAFSWQGMIGRNQDQFGEYFTKYVAASNECVQAAHKQTRLNLIEDQNY